MDGDNYIIFAKQLIPLHNLDDHYTDIHRIPKAVK